MSRCCQIRVTPITILAHLLFIAITTLVLVWLLLFREGVGFHSSNTNRIFNLHPLLMVIGFILGGGVVILIIYTTILLATAIMTYKSFPEKRKSIVVVIRLLLHLKALASAIFGIISVYKSKQLAGFPNLYTLHSWLGILAIFSFVFQYIFAFFAYLLFPGRVISIATRDKRLPWHKFIGMTIFLLAVITAETGLVEYFQRLDLLHGAEALIVNFIGLLLFLFAIFVSLSVIQI